ncbi:MAG: hypothetical protein V1755_03915 [Chloroflexota bacterium]
MHRRKLTGAIIILGAALIGVGAVALATAQPAQAQCGSQASSCKNCHETQAQMPVNADGTGWHESHAFGDFCYICHAGNNQATEAEAAHAGMVAPMTDVQSACAQCHPNDLVARADVYTVALGIPAASIRKPSAAASPAPTATVAAPELAAQPAAAPAPAAALSPNDPNLVDYVERYNQEVLNQKPTNWGNIILLILLLGLIGIGVFFINRREGWISISFSEKKGLDKEYPQDVVGIADQATKLNTSARRSLARLLAKPAATAGLLAALDRLSADEPSGDKQ